jgi:uncharacterized protein (TIGR02996 family)
MKEAALHRAILKAPDDMDPRLAYADWLDEQGQSVPAVMIREMCAAPDITYGLLSGVNTKSGWVVCIPGHNRNEKRRAYIRTMLPQQVSRSASKYTIRRGLIEEADVMSVPWFRNADMILACQPVTKVRVRNLTTRFNWAIEVAHARGMTRADLVRWVRGCDRRDRAWEETAVAFL